MAEQPSHGNGVYMQQLLGNRAMREAVSYQMSVDCGTLEAGALDTAATLQNRQDLIHDPILLVLLSRQRNAEQVLACIHADDLIDNPAL
jgi:hypothetical protein